MIRSLLPLRSPNDVTVRSRTGAAANVTTIVAPEVPVSDPVLFDSFQIQLFVPAVTDDAVADAARSALDDPPFPELVRDVVTQLLGAVPALTVLTAVVE